jgi:glycosyltransferase involved in cell wall biosynthesis
MTWAPFYATRRVRSPQKSWGEGARVLEMGNMRVVWFAEIKWDYLRTRKQQLIRRRPRGVDVLYFEPYARGRENHYALRDVDGVRVATVPFLKSAPPGPARMLLDVPAVRRAVDAVVARRVRGHFAQAGIQPAQSVFVLSNVFAVRVAAGLASASLVYDCNDAHAAFPGMPRWTRDYQLESFRRADRVIVSSRALHADAVAVRGSDVNVHFVGNGVDLRVFRTSLAPLPPAPDAVRVGYLGAIGPWFDFDLMEALARLRPRWQVTVVGPILAGVEAAVARLASLPNVTIEPAVAHEDVPRVLAGFTVGTIPFQRTPLTAGVNPNKLYEYLAAGVPTVATPFSADLEVGPALALASDAGAFVAACENFVAARLDPARGAELSGGAAAEAAKHDWDAIAADFWRRVLPGAAA